MGTPTPPQSHASDLERIGVLAALRSALDPVVRDYLPEAIAALTEKEIDNGDYDEHAFGNNVWLIYDGLLRAVDLAMQHGMDLLRPGQDHGLKARYDALAEIFSNEEPRA